MAHDRQKESTGSWNSHKDTHQAQQKQLNEKKKQNDDWVPKGETNAERAARLQRQKKNS